MADDSSFNSIHDLAPLESGGVEARKGFEFQDHVAVSLLLEMLTDNEISEVWCETHDDITVIWNDGVEDAVEFVQVKALAIGQLWSVAKLTERERKKKKAIIGSSILERSLANDRCDETTTFRLVTTLPPNEELAFLHLRFDAPDREYKDLSELVADLKKRLDDYQSPKKNGVEYWLKRTMWEVHQSESSLSATNKLALHQHIVSLGHNLFPDEINEIYLALLSEARHAATANWGSNPDQKKIKKSSLASWLRKEVDARRSPPAVAGKRLEDKLEHAGLVKGDITACVESRHQYLVERYKPKYLNVSELQRVENEVSATLLALRANLDAGVINDDGVAFHAECLNHIGVLQSSFGESAPPISLMQGCMYNIADRCVHRFRRAST